MNGPAGELRVAFGETGFLQARSNRGSPVKRAFDLALCLLATPVALVVGIPIAFALVLGGGQVLYAQSRVGAQGRWFDCLKFRSMVCDAEARLKKVLATDALARNEWEHYQKLSQDPRITRFGRFLRASSLDELPQLINVWRGDMSIVGPRPIMVEQIERYGEHYAAYCRMKPGITGLWQVSGRNRRTFAERVHLDVHYVNTWSLAGDILIILRTLPAILAGSGAR